MCIRVRGIMDENSKIKEDSPADNSSSDERKDYALIEILMRLSALEKVLVENGTVTLEDLIKHVKNSADTLLERMKANADQQSVINIPGNKSNLKN